jgi:hypothetical protein
MTRETQQCWYLDVTSGPKTIPLPPSATRQYSSLTGTPFLPFFCPLHLFYSFSFRVFLSSSFNTNKNFPFACRR